jgi:amino acid adenylation domain-containing protein
VPLGSYQEKTLHALFEDQAARVPDAVALIDGDGELSFRGLDEQANRLANHLIDRGVRPRALVGVCLERSRDSVIAAFAILKAGAAYVPLDPDYPPMRLAFFAADTGLEFVVTRECFLKRLPQGLDAVCVDRDFAEIAGRPITAPRVAIGPDDWCFVVYTSGSTGTPKGVGSPHRATVVMISWLWDAYPFGPDERFCHRTTLNFIVSAWEIFAPLLHGAPVALAPREATRDPRSLIAFLDTARVTRILLVPTLLRALLDTMEESATPLRRVRYWICVGEPLQSDLARRMLHIAPAATILNLYGCSETHSATCYCVREHVPELPTVPIGKPLSNRRVYLLDEHGERAGPGAIGEIYIGGDGLSRGYINRQELSSERFVAGNRFGEDVVYRTGDRARLHSDGNLQLLGRLDRQVQIRGHRVEPLEVEAILLAHPSIRQCAVTVRDVGGHLELAAYLVSDDPAPSPTDVREALKLRLPEPMVPSSFTFMRELPTTPNGKLDQLALPDPARSRTLSTLCIPPRTATEATLCEIWADILAVHPIGVSDSFFDLGGYSNKAATTIARMRDELGAELPLESFFKLQTIEKIAAEIDAIRWLADRPANTSGDVVQGIIE